MDSTEDPLRRGRKRAPGTAWAAQRAGRFLRPDRNPLRRRTDRLEAAIILSMVMFMLLASPVLTAGVARALFAIGVRAEHAGAATGYWVPGKLLTAPTAVGPVSGSTLDGPAVVKVRWKAPGGAQWISEVRLGSATAAGAAIRMWIPRRTTGAPIIDRPMLVTGAIGIAMLTPALLLLLLLLCYRAARRALDRRRLADWESGWSKIGPEWTSKR